MITTLELGLNSICNLTCPLCTRNKIIFKNRTKFPKFSPTNLDFGKLIEFINNLKDLKEIKIVGAVGEPTLYPKFLELLIYCNANGIKIWLSTNGSTRDTEWWYQVGKLITEGSIINFDIDHTDPIKQKIYRRGSDLNKIIKNIKAAQNAIKEFNRNIEIRAQRIEFNWNKDNKEKFIEFCEKDLNIKPYIIPCYDFDQKEFKDDISFFSHPKQKDYMLFRKSSQINDKNQIICEAKQKNMIYLNYLGEVIPCCYINDEILKENESYFNIYDNTFGQIIENYKRLTDYQFDYQDKNFTKTCYKYCNKFSKNLCNLLKIDP